MPLPIAHPHPITQNGQTYDLVVVSLAMNTQPMAGDSSALRSAVILTPYRVGDTGAELLQDNTHVVSVADAAAASDPETPVERLAFAITTAVQAYVNEVL